jgi:hypothetical protein
MGRTFQLVEPFEHQQGLSAPFLCGQPVSAPVEIFRMLNGTLDIVRKDDGSRVKCRQNHISLKPSSGRTSDRKISHSLFGEDVTVSDARKIISALSQSYRKFFSELSCEIEHCIFLQRRNHHVESFLHFYRSLEKLAVAFPVMYITAKGDFHQIHSLLKPLFTKDGGELSFVSKFSDYLSDKSDVLGEYKLTFEFQKDSQPIICDELDQILRGGKIIDAIEREDSKFYLPYRYVGPLLIECRNRLFHNSNSGQRNIDIDRLGGAATVCGGLVKTGLHWLALTYLEVLRNRAEILNVT